MAELVVVTGAGSGIGAAVARKFAGLGHPVALADVNLAAAEAVAGDLVSRGQRAVAGGVDVTDPSAVASFVDEQVHRFGAPAAAVACAGISGIGLVTDMPPDEFDRIVAVNLKGVYCLARSVLPHMAQGGGSFIAIASDAGYYGFQGFAAYCASKHGVIGLIKAMALDHGPAGIRCNAICPGNADTPLLDRLLQQMPGERGEYENAVPLGRFASPDDVANLAAFLASEAGSYISGSVLPIDGGGAAGPFTPPAAR